MKSIYQRLGEVTEQLAEVGKFTKYVEESANCKSIESKINCAERILKTEVSESKPPIIKHNGAGDNGRGTEFRESAGTIGETAFAKADEVLFKALGFSETDQRRLKGLPPAGESLTPSQLREFRFLRSIKLSEADALAGAKRVS